MTAGHGVTGGAGDGRECQQQYLHSTKWALTHYSWCKTLSCSRYYVQTFINSCAWEKSLLGVTRRDVIASYAGETFVWHHMIYAHKGSRTSFPLTCIQWWPLLHKSTHQLSKMSWDHSSYHCNDVIMSMMASQITSPTIAYITVYSGPDQGKHQSSASLAIVRGIFRTKDQ